MPTLICDFRPSAAAWAHEYFALREAGEPLVAFWPLAATHPGMIAAGDAPSLERILEDERIACLAGCPQLPAWLPVDDFNRVLLLSDAPDAPGLRPEEGALVEALFAGGCEAVEMLSDPADLAQSWHSGRRVGVRILPRVKV